MFQILLFKQIWFNCEVLLSGVQHWDAVAHVSIVILFVDEMYAYLGCWTIQGHLWYVIDIWNVIGSIQISLNPQEESMKTVVHHFNMFPYVLND